MQEDGLFNGNVAKTLAAKETLAVLLWLWKVIWFEDTGMYPVHFSLATESIIGLDPANIFILGEQLGLSCQELMRLQIRNVIAGTNSNILAQGFLKSLSYLDLRIYHLDDPMVSALPEKSAVYVGDCFYNSVVSELIVNCPAIDFVAFPIGYEYPESHLRGKVECRIYIVDVIERLTALGLIESSQSQRAFDFLAQQQKKLVHTDWPG